MNDAGLWAIVALISPKKTAKENARSIIGDTFFKDINLNTPISICENGTLRTYI
jgi:adenylylsulfate kinase